jgi:hypothetical protein
VNVVPTLVRLKSAQTFALPVLHTSSPMHEPRPAVRRRATRQSPA